MPDRFIPVAEPTFIGNERKYVLECVDTTWVSANGHFVTDFEGLFADFAEVEHAVACSSGTAALHLAVAALGIGPRDEVIVPTLTYIASANAVAYCGGTPVFIDVETETWNLDPKAVEGAITRETKAVMAVHLFGNPAAMDPILRIAKDHDLAVIEDAAEAVGAEYDGRRVGGLGRVGVFSLFGNKIITSGEGGVVTTDDAELAARMRLLRNQGVDPSRRYWHSTIGYNYRMTNLAAAVALAQLECIEWHLDARARVRRWYEEHLGGLASRVVLQPLSTRGRHVHWMVAAEIHGFNARQRDAVMETLRESGIDTRPMFYPIHTMPPYEGSRSVIAPVSARLSSSGVVLPTSARLGEKDVVRICNTLGAAVEHHAVL